MVLTQADHQAAQAVAEVVVDTAELVAQVELTQVVAALEARLTAQLDLMAELVELVS
jgi:hypothetical protein